MDALNQALVDCADRLTAEEELTLRRGIGHAMASILENILEPLLGEHPALEVPEREWGAIAQRRRLERSAKDDVRGPSGKS